jgi:cysteine dioxygenase
MEILKKFKEIDLLFEQQKDKITGPAELTTLVKNFEFHIGEFDEAIEFPEDLPYGRTLLYQSTNFEVILMNWKPKNGSNIHDHGNSFGSVYVLSGDVNNIAYDPELNKIGTFKQSKGDYIDVPKGIFHQLQNLNDTYSASLHFYAPPIQGMKVFDASDIQKSYIVKSESGAWNPSEKDIVKIL